ncbi:Transcriptional regulator, LysR family protein [Oceanicola granulosus HTCC2516]|uniref:Transcriptional regulator, LysR family protein n=1 Tax=Oceanicola granulosus (strain ATCC BAA-861 / DSM 15982 / KCTC 12143 / HTCC2516) TaxID=314256 RepID=Q2CA22_OCEGH|nr:LysR family transcriptional regulator [Oceanicola granulosus]EAR49515.1 Transcriptional regulator, LysR family protein [Oceanicola granulosus HTCC2516]
MNWDDIRVFLAVARAESLTGAARALKLDPGTVGRRIARLEDELGAALFAKSPQGYALTDRGARMRDHAAGAESALRAALDEGQGEEGLTGQVRIGAPDGCANFLLPRVCAAIAADNPALDIQVLSLPRVVNLSRREADMAITVSAPEAGRLTVQKITDYHLHLARHRDLPPGPDAPVVGYIPDMIFDRELDYLSELGTERVRLASNSVAVQLQMLRQGGALGIVHDFALPFAPELVRTDTDRVSLTRSFYLVRHAADRRSDRLNRLARALADGLRAEVARLEAMVQDT